MIGRIELGLVRLCSESDVVDNSIRRFVVEGREILLVKIAGKYYALDSKCTHRGGPLSEGTLKDRMITYPLGILGSLILKPAK